MADRRINIRITVDNSDAIRQTQAQTAATQGLSAATDKHTHLQNGLTNSFIKGNLAARAISVSYIAVKDSITALVSGASNLEFTLAKVAASTGANSVGLKTLEASIFKLGRETSSSIESISEASLELAKLGFSGKELEIVLGGVSRLSAALGDSLEATGELVGGVVNTFDLSSEQAASVADKLFVATGKSAANIESFKVAFGLAGNVAANAGVSFEELAAAIATLSNQGIRASTIGTGLRTFITNLSVEGSKAQKGLGGSFGEMGLLGAMERMADIKPGAGSIFEMFGKPGSPVASALMNSTAMYKEFLAAVQSGQGTLQAGGSIINETLVGNVIRLKNATVELFTVWTKAPMAAVSQFFGEMSLALNQVTDEINDSKRFQDFMQKHNSRAGNFQDGIKSAVKELGLEGKRFSDDELFNAFLRKEKQDKIKNDTYLRIAQSMQKEEALKHGLGLPDTRPTVELDINKKKKPKKEEPDFDPMDVFDRLQDMDIHGETYQEKFMREYNEDREKRIKKEKEDAQKALDEDFKAREELLKLIEKEEAKQSALNKALSEYKEQLTADAIAVEHLDFVMQSLAASTNVFGDFVVDTFLGHDDAFSSFADAFGNMAKRIVSDLIAMELRLLAFKFALRLFAAFTAGAGGTLLPGGGAPAMLPPGVGISASGFDGVVRQPTMFVAGEAGAENVKITPRAKLGAGDSESAPTFIIQGDVYDFDRFQRKVKHAVAMNGKDYV